MTRTLRAVETPLDPDRDDVVVIPAPGKPRVIEHPALRPLQMGSLDWFMLFRENLRVDPNDEAEACKLATEQWLARRNHAGKGRRFQPAATR